MKRFLIYLGWTVAIGFFIFLCFILKLSLEDVNKTSYNLPTLVIYNSLFPVFIGIVLRIPVFIREIKDKKILSFDWLKLVVIGLPSLYLSQIEIIYYFTPFGHKLPFSTYIVYNFPLSLFAIVGVIFGYNLLYSLKSSGN